MAPRKIGGRRVAPSPKKASAERPRRVSGAMALSEGDFNPQADPLYLPFQLSVVHVEEEAERAGQLHHLLVCSPSDALVLYRWISPAVPSRSPEERKLQERIVEKVVGALQWTPVKLKTWLTEARSLRLNSFPEYLKFINSLDETVKAGMVYFLRALLKVEEIAKTNEKEEGHEDDKAFERGMEDLAMPPPIDDC